MGIILMKRTKSPLKRRHFEPSPILVCVGTVATSYLTETPKR